MDIMLTDKPSRQDRQGVLGPLGAFNRRTAGPGRWRRLGVLVRDDAGATTGGLTGQTGYGWLFIELMFVPEPLRGAGLGRRLVEQALHEARKRSCHSAWVDTFSFQARAFYEKLGFSVFGELPNYPQGARFFLSRTL